MASFSHRELTMAVQRFGHGPLTMLAFHGFGRTGRDFALLSTPLADLCTIHAFDLPFHGESPGLPANAPVSAETWAAYFEAYLQHLGAPKAGLMGYSLGGRLALCLLERAPQLVDMAFLMAPDGLVPRPWYRGLAHHRPGRWLYEHFVDHPTVTHAIVGLLFRAGLMDQRMHHFIMDSTATRGDRALLYQVWTGFRSIEPALATVAGNLREWKIPVHLLLGEQDRVIRASMGNRLHHLAPDRVQVHLLPMGHRLLNEASGTRIAEIVAARTPPWAGPPGSAQ